MKKTEYDIVEDKFDVIDRQVFDILHKYVPEHSDIAIDTYRFGLLLRQVALDELEKKDNKESKILSIVKNEAVTKLIILLTISLAKFGYKPLTKMISRK